MNLSNEERQEFHDALLNAFPSYEKLKMMVSFKLGINLNQITDKVNLNYNVFELMNWAEEQGRMEELIRGAYDKNPGNPKLRAFYQKKFRMTDGEVLRTKETEFSADKPQSLKRRVLTESLAKLENEYQLVNQQIDETIDEGNRSRLKIKAERIFKEIETLQSDLENL